MLVAVVGPSGAGKDTVLDGLRHAGHVIARRAITRPAGAGGEAHVAMSEAEFTGHDFALQWQAHGLRYGIFREIEAEMAQGRVVLANLSRTVLAQAAARYPFAVLEITAPPAILAGRLAARGRESAADITARLAREAPLPPGLRVLRVVNDTTPEAAIAAAEKLLASLKVL